ncbi:MAG: thiamine diphosphokinase [Firmicutes bacterium]|nr:thiamine diphosphokinase [Bacillota bacterium]
MNHSEEGLCKAVIIGLGADVPENFSVSEHALVICADGGMKWAKKWGIVPDFVFGDFDSIDDESKKFVETHRVKKYTFPVEKDKTDVELAVDYCIANGVSDVTLVGVWGGRIDHSLGNLEILYKLGECGINGRIKTREMTLEIINKSIVLELVKGMNVSLIALTKEVTGVSTKGLYYPLQEATIMKGTTLGISNQAISESVKITVNEGILLVIY